MHTTEFELLETLSQPVCPVCTLARREARTYLVGVFEDGINDPAVRDDWRARGGLCARHWREVREFDSVLLPATILLRDLLGSYLDHPSPVWKMPDCPACKREAEAEVRHFKALLGIPEATMLKALEDGPGFLCLRHLVQMPPGTLRNRFESRLISFLPELDELERKQDYRFSKEPLGNEKDSWLRAMRALGGEV
ncbi:hypothetical protein [Meiothermus granaticius]|uniref:Uncharacterized protein n=1 Tax=Meiothermus granaticius NBRC 107808 TaxID=1227551 RepID=A0A399FEP7_9DEIN|nr:hypothetical protein [Meiothermus granaticius]MCL6527905.1 hypothetical protein [Thermaceae bacterium]RIH93612.1 hypothetical protein Mgrana_00436 [Meiothermus granaticius NBRC 107808]GEM87249.1 hypothetical protein MGR01S_18740 [Meiothermus granaticius NBRC 107808]